LDWTILFEQAKSHKKTKESELHDVENPSYPTPHLIPLHLHHSNAGEGVFPFFYVFLSGARRSRLIAGGGPRSGAIRGMGM
jgi:hypothetical protein